MMQNKKSKKSGNWPICFRVEKTCFGTGKANSGAGKASFSTGQIYLSAWLPVAVWMLGLFLLSGRSRLPGPEDEGWRLVFMKGAHISVYVGLYFWLWRGWQLTALKNKLSKKWLFWGRRDWSADEKRDYLAFNKANKANLVWLVLLAVCTLYGMSDEWHQSFVPGRTATWWDVGFDTLGATMGMAILYWRR